MAAVVVEEEEEEDVVVVAVEEVAEEDEDDAECTDSDLRRALTTLGSRPLTHAQVTDLLAVAALCGAADGGAPSSRRRGGAPVPVRARRLASILGMDRGVKPEKVRRFCGCCAV